MADASNGGMIDRIRGILLNPKREWEVIEGEPATVSGLMTAWVAPLAAIGPVAMLIGNQMFGTGSYLVRFRPAMTYAVTDALLQYAVALAAAYACALIVDALATSFGGQKDPVRAMKTVAYGGTAAYLSGIFFILPPLSVLAIAGLYSAYLFWLGLPAMMGAPKEKAVPYLAVVIVAMLVVGLVLGAIKNAVMSAVFPGSFPSVVYGM